MQLGADGIILSNHGGRQLNFAPAAVDMLPSVAEAVGGRVPLLVDGGITRGTGKGRSRINATAHATVLREGTRAG